MDYYERYTAEHAEAAGRFCEASLTGRQGPLVTVCVPHYNLGRHLPETLASLAAQTYPHLEVLVIDDGSTDPASLEVFGRMERRHPQFRFLRQANAGIGATRNRGLFEGRGISERFTVETGEMPNRITLYRRPILDYWAENEETLGDIVTHVLIHEIGHHFGLSDDDMERIEASAEIAAG